MTQAQVHEPGGLEDVAVDDRHEALAARLQRRAGEQLRLVTISLHEAGQPESRRRTGDHARRPTGATEFEQLGVHLGEQLEIVTPPRQLTEAAHREDQPEVVLLATEDGDRVEQALGRGVESPSTRRPAPSAKLT